MVHALRSLLKVRLYEFIEKFHIDVLIAPELSDHSHAHCLGTGNH